MTFSVAWLKGPNVMGTKDFEDLDSATRYAEDHLSQMQRLFGATAVKIVDEAGTPHFLKSISRNP
jgi:hypothetical protein